ncbi:MAG TPA: DUF1343 domain-containing protein [Longimicrobium sp.]|jgi:uncharacterized protein YbbC (DUF1343 family)
MKRHIALPALLVLACAPAEPGAPEPVQTTTIRPGIEVFLERPPAAVVGKRVGLITNHTGVDRQGRSSADLLAASPHFRLVSLFGPEHGIRGVLADGDVVASGRDEKTGLPVHSLYGDTREPTEEMLRDVDVLVFDIQDVGARTYTYVSTMALAMQAAKKKGIPFIVLDRPNPIGGEVVEGGMLEPKHATFVGMYPIALRHGMTAGELARLFNTEFNIGADLTVVPVEGWRRSTWFDATGLPWLNPSPNIRRLEAAIHYPGTVLFEGTNLSEGRGTDLPFEQAGAPWLDAPAVAAELNRMRLPGVRFEAVRYPIGSSAAKYPGQTVPGVRFILTDRASYRPVRTALIAIDAIRRRHPQHFRWSGTMDRLAGTDRVRSAIEGGTLPALLADWDRQAEIFRVSRATALLYN